jgi:hypothetical protein
VDLTGFDQLTPADGRLEASVWSWARGEPRGHGCAVQRTTAAPAGSTAPPPSRWYARSCVARRRAACRNADGVWVLSRELVFQKRAAAACRRLGSALSVPRTGYEAQRLRLAMSGLGDAETWLGYRVRRGLWMAADRRG